MKNLVIVLVVALALASCKKERLDLVPVSEIGSNGFYTNADELELATIAIYDGLQAVPLREFAVTEMRSDNARSNSSEGDWGQFEDFAVLPTNQAIGQYWTANYNVIFRANRVLDNLDASESASRRAIYEGEAKFTRALAHFNLVRAYGDVPIADRVIGIEDYDFFSRDPEADVLSFITADLIEAVTLLPSKGALEFGRATQEAAQALLAKVYLTTGNYGGAESLLAAVIASPSYELEANYRDVFYNEGNDEIIFAIPYLNDDNTESQDFSFEMTAGGVRNGLNYLTNDFLANLSPLDSIRTPVIRSEANPEANGKYLANSGNARLCGNDWIVLRLADVYLMHVEAIMAGMPATQSIAAIESYNAVRGRAKQSLIPTDGSGEITLETLSQERRIELSFENHRLYDLVRTGQAQTVLSAFAASEGNTFTSTDLLLPIPQGQINVSSGRLVQNPGY